MLPALRLLNQVVRQKWALRRGREGILALQKERLRTLLARAKKESPFYAERLRDIDPERFELAQLRSVPTLTKTEMMELLFALQMGRASVFPTTPLGILTRLFSRARLASITIGRGFYPSSTG